MGREGWGCGDWRRSVASPWCVWLTDNRLTFSRRMQGRSVAPNVANTVARLQKERAWQAKVDGGAAGDGHGPRVRRGGQG